MPNFKAGDTFKLKGVEIKVHKSNQGWFLSPWNVWSMINVTKEEIIKFSSHHFPESGIFPYMRTKEEINNVIQYLLSFNIKISYKIYKF